MTLNKKKHTFHVLLRVVWLFITLLALVFLLLKQQWIYALFTLPFLLWAIGYFVRYTTRIGKEMREFVEAIHYRDFTRHYALGKSPVELQSLRSGLNEINNEFRTIMRERETQHQYLRKILELVDTGILSFDIASGEVTWMNDALKEMLDLPYLKNISRLERRNSDLFQTIKTCHHGESQMITFRKETHQLKILLNVTAFQTEGKRYRLIAFQNVSDALDATESRAWQKLLNVMTHEIMNSVAPIASLADTLKTRLQQQRTATGQMEDLELGIATIQRRSEGLIRFANLYRNLNKISELDKSTFLVRELFENVYQLMGPTLLQKGIELEIVLPDAGLKLEADRNLMEQVLINLILNAMEALRGRNAPRLILTGNETENGRPFLMLQDNGKGIPEELLDRIFIPFFSTKKAGNGIGLSLCKQIMLLHGGNMRVDSQEGSYTRFYLLFRKRA